MPAGSGNGFLEGLGINMSTVVLIATVFATIAAQWAIMGNSIDDQEQRGSIRDQRIAAAEVRLYAVERDLATMTVRYENLRDALIELRRRAGLDRRLNP